MDYIFDKSRKIEQVKGQKKFKILDYNGKGVVLIEEEDGKLCMTIDNIKYPMKIAEQS